MRLHLQRGATSLESSLPLLLSSIFFLNPVVVIDSAIWGQVESFGILFTLLAIILLFYRRPLIATFLFTVGTLMKLQNIIFIPLYFLFLFRHYDLHTLVKSIGMAVFTFFVVNLPFVLANNMDKVLFLLTVNSDYFPWMSLNANNLWWIVSGADGMHVTDKMTVFGILNAKTTGLILFSSFYLLFMILLYKKPSARNLFLSLTLAIFAFFLFTTQSHERYSYPVVVLLLFLYPFLESKSVFAQQNKISEDRIRNRVSRLWTFENLKIAVNNLWTTLSRNTKILRARKFCLREKTQYTIGSTNYYFWLLYLLLTLAIFFNIHMGLVDNYPQNGFDLLTRLTSPQLTIVNSYVLIFLFLLLLPYIFSQISKWFLLLSVFCYLLSVLVLNSSYLIKGQVSLTAFKPIISKQDFGVLQVNKAANSASGWKSWQRLAVDYLYYRKGFGTHANSKLVFDIDRKFSKFVVDMGVDTAAGTPASVVFQIYADGRRLFESKKLGRFDFPQHTEVDITGVKYLGLEVTDSGDGINSDHADWLNPVLIK